jgi:hypothetical protein
MTDEEREEIMATARRNIERLSEPRAAAPERAEWRRPDPEPPAPKREPEPDIAPVDVHAAIAAAIEAEREFVMRCVGEALGEYVGEHRREIEQMIGLELKLVRGELADARIAMCNQMVKTIDAVQGALRAKAEPVDITPARGDAKLN